MPPIPICRQEPSSISAAMRRAYRAINLARVRVGQLRARLIVALDE